MDFLENEASYWQFAQNAFAGKHHGSANHSWPPLSVNPVDESARVETDLLQHGNAPHIMHFRKKGNAEQVDLIGSRALQILSL